MGNAYFNKMMCYFLTSRTNMLTSGGVQAIRVMRDQRTGGHIFNMDGAGADGDATPRFAAYGATKRGLVQLSRSLQVWRPFWPCFAWNLSLT